MVSSMFFAKGEASKYLLEVLGCPIIFSSCKLNDLYCGHSYFGAQNINSPVFQPKEEKILPFSSCGVSLSQFFCLERWLAYPKIHL